MAYNSRRKATDPYDPPVLLSSRLTRESIGLKAGASTAAEAAFEHDLRCNHQRAPSAL